MTTLTAAAVLALAASCQSLVAPITVQKIAFKESGFDPRAVHVNADGSRDRGLMQINDRNDSFLGLSDPFDPCQSIRAAAALWANFSRYNSGSPTKSLQYAMAVQAVHIGVDPLPPIPTPPTPPPNPFARPARTGRDLIFNR